MYRLSHPVFFPPSGAVRLDHLAQVTGATLSRPEFGEVCISSIAPLEAAGKGALAFLENAAYAKHAASTQATACFISPRFSEKLNPACIGLITPDPYRAFAKAAAILYPSAAAPQAIFGGNGIAPGAFIHTDARLESGVTVDPGVVIGAGAEIGAGTVLCANAVIGAQVRIGRNCAIGPGASITHALVGNRVILHAGVRLGQDGFGFAMGPGGHLKVPQVGRVIVQDDVEIGANTTVDRGANRDTIIGEGTKIDNLVQIGHNVVIGRHCVIVGQVGISGSTVLEDYVVLGGQVGIAGHLRIGMGAQVGAKSGVMNDLAAGGKYLGAPAKAAKQVFREIAALTRLAQRDDTARG